MATSFFTVWNWVYKYKKMMPKIIGIISKYTTFPFFVLASCANSCANTWKPLYLRAEDGT